MKRPSRRGRLRSVSAGSVPGLLLSFCVSSSAFADTIILSEKGVAAVKGKSRAQVVASADGKHQLVHGRFVVSRDAQDLPTLPSPGIFIAFQPRSKDTGGKAAWNLGPLEKWEWLWVREVGHIIDTLDDVRDMISNRDRRYGSMTAALTALRADIDPSGSLGLRGGSAVPAVTNSRLKPREGTVSRYLLSGPLPPEKRSALIKEARSRPLENPLGYSPLDPLFRGEQTPETTMAQLVEALGRSEKYGEPQNGLRAACLAVARFVTEELFVAEEKENGPDREKVLRIRAFVLEARATILRYIEGASPEGVSIRLARRATRGSSTEDPLRATHPDDDLPLDIFEQAKAGLEVVAAMTTPRQEDQGHVVEVLLAVASGRADFRGGRNAVTLPPEIQNRQEAVAQQAFDTLVRLSAAAPDPRSDLAAGFREMMLNFFASSYSGVRDSGVMAAREALVRSGIGSETEIKPLVDALFDIALSSILQPSDPTPGSAIYVLKRLPGNIADERLRQRFQARINERLRELEERQRAGTGGRQESRFLELFAGGR